MIEDAVLNRLLATDRANVKLHGLLVELYNWAEDACEQGTGQPRGEPGWHSFISTWEEADELLPRVAKALGR